MSPDSLIYTLIVWVPPILFAITLHEAAHGYVAYMLGDTTAKKLGRITVNPFVHIDPIGTVLLPIFMAFTTGFVFGWARPVPVDIRQFDKPMLDMGLVAVAGPASNFVMACIWAVLVVIALKVPDVETRQLLYAMGQNGILINVLLLSLNLLPILPLDGGRVLAAVLPPSLASVYMRLEPFGLVIVVLLLVSGGLQFLLVPVMQQFQNIIRVIFGF